jgi:hypothetical protein
MTDSCVTPLKVIRKYTLAISMHAGGPATDCCDKHHSLAPDATAACPAFFCIIRHHYPYGRYGNTHRRRFRLNRRGEFVPFPGFLFYCHVSPSDFGPTCSRKDHVPSLPSVQIYVNLLGSFIVIFNVLYILVLLVLVYRCGVWIL